MARITVEDCLKRVSSRFMLVNMVAKRVRQIREGSDYLVSSPKMKTLLFPCVKLLRAKSLKKYILTKIKISSYFINDYWSWMIQ